MRALAGMWSHKWLVLAVAVVAMAGAGPFARAIFGPAVVVATAQRAALSETVVASGHVETPFRVEIGSQITGVVDDVMVAEGQSVDQGQILVALGSAELKATLAQAEGVVAQAEARMRQMQELTLPSARQALAQAQATLINAERSFARTQELAAKSFATRASLDDAQKNLDVARTQVRSAELQVYTSSPGGSDYVMAQTQLNQARASLELAQSRLDYATIRAPRAGVLISRAVERGTVAQPGKALMVLAPRGQTQLVLQLDERNLGKIALGQKAVASADAFPDRKFPAQVSYINPGIDISKASVEVKLDVVDPPAFLRQDMTVSIDIEVARRDDTLVLPARAVRDALSGDPWVMGVRDGRAARLPVRIGLRGNAQVEISEGLAEGALALPVTSGVVIGQRVRPVLP
jgi:HlyD family secretion protein